MISAAPSHLQIPPATSVADEPKENGMPLTIFPRRFVLSLLGVPLHLENWHKPACCGKSHGCSRWNRFCLQEGQSPVCQDHVTTGCFAGDSAKSSLSHTHIHTYTPSLFPFSFLTSLSPFLLPFLSFLTSGLLFLFLSFSLSLFPSFPLSRGSSEKSQITLDNNSIRCQSLHKRCPPLGGD